MAYDDSLHRRRDTASMDAAGANPRDGARHAAYPGYDSDLRFDRDHRDDEDRLEEFPSPEPVRRRPVPPAALHDVFDDPAHGEPGRDRLAVHILWEIVLLIGVAGLAYLLHLADPDAVRGAELDRLLVFGAALGLLALGAGLTLRAGVPNLALGPVAIAAALHFAEQGDRGVVAAMLPAALYAAALGVLIALLVVGFHVPAWAASLAAALVAIVFNQQRSEPVLVQSGYDPTRHSLYLFGGFAAIALLGGLFGAIKPLRRSVGRFRPVGDPAQRRGGAAAMIAGLAIVVSMIFAVAAGMLLAAGGTAAIQPTTGIEWTGLALGIAMIAGTSAFGRRGGIFGTLFAAALLALFITYAAERDLRIALAAVAGVTLAVGLVVTRLVESYGRPRSANPDSDWLQDAEPASESVWDTEATSRPPWSSPLPAQPAAHRGDTWGPGSWGGPER